MYPIIPPHIISVDVRKKNEIIHNLLNNMKLKQINVLAIMLATGGLILPSCKGNSNQQAQGGQAPELAVMTVSENDAALETAYPTSLEGENDVEIRPQVSGFLTKVLVEDGQHVSKGQVLLQSTRCSFRLLSIRLRPLWQWLKPMSTLLLPVPTTIRFCWTKTL